jgi:hypothetical protein
MRYLLLLIWMTLTTLNGVSQNLSSFGSKSAYGLSGSINLGFNFYDVTGDRESVYAPLGYQANGVVTARLGSITVPMQFAFSQTGNTASSPFNLYGASPYYKWIKLHLGFRTLSFSPYVYSGRGFTGAGIELSPGKFKFTAFRGKMRNLLAIRQAELNETILLPSYDRWISGSQLTYGSRSNSFQLMAVHIADKEENLDGIDLLPEENLVLGSSLKLKLLKRIAIGVNANVSLLTGNINGSSTDDIDAIAESFGNITNLNITTRASLAGDASLAYEYNRYRLGIVYKRINPYYTSLGTNYLQNDIQQITLDAAVPLLDNKLRLKGSIGREEDNLFNHKAFTSIRIIGSLSALYRHASGFLIQSRYNNYQQENDSGIYVVEDSVRVLTTTSNIMLNTSFGFLKKENLEGKATLNIFNNQVIDNTEENESSELFNGKGGYANAIFTLKELGLSVGPIFNYNAFSSSFTDQQRIGFGLNAGKQFWENKLYSNLNALYNISKSDSTEDGHFLSVAWSTRYNINKSLVANFRLNHNNNQGIVSQSFSEWRGQLMLSYRWNLNKTKN